MLQILNISDNSITHLESFSNCPSLWELNLSFNKITDAKDFYRGFSDSPLLNLRSINIKENPFVAQRGIQIEENFLKFVPALHSTASQVDEAYNWMVNFMVMNANKCSFVEKQARSQIRVNHVFGIREGKYALNAAPQHLSETLSRSPDSIFKPTSLSDWPLLALNKGYKSLERKKKAVRIITACFGKW